MCDCIRRDVTLLRSAKSHPHSNSRVNMSLASSKTCDSSEQREKTSTRGTAYIPPGLCVTTETRPSDEPHASRRPYSCGAHATELTAKDKNIVLFRQQHLTTTEMSRVRKGHPRSVKPIKKQRRAPR